MLKTMNTMMITFVQLVAELEKAVGKVLTATNAKELVAIQNSTGMTIMSNLDVLKQALEALENAWLDASMGKGDVARHTAAITSIRQAIADAEKQEPDDLTIAYMNGVYDGKNKYSPQRQWVELSVNEMVELIQKYRDTPVSLVAAVETKLKEKNT